MTLRRFVATLVLLVALQGCAGGGFSRTFMLPYAAGSEQPISYFRPASATAAAPVVFVMHGVRRDAQRYLTEWQSLAEQHGFVVVVPEFSEGEFPGAAGYSLGGTFDAAGQVLPRERWAYSHIEKIFDAVVQREQLLARGYKLYGHSAGAQFVHRFVLLGAGPRLELAVAANAGWYTLPSLDVPWPYGLAGAPGSDFPLATALSTPLVVLVGDRDIDRQDPDLRRTPQAMAQGPHRLARAQRFYAEARTASDRMGVALGWSCFIASGVAHQNARAAAFAAPLLALDSAVTPGGDCTVLEASGPG
jgi:hypothetical protein